MFNFKQGSQNYCNEYPQQPMSMSLDIPQSPLTNPHDEEEPSNSFTEPRQALVPQNMQSTIPLYVAQTPKSTSNVPAPIIQNIVSTCTVGTTLDLKKIAMHARNAEYNPKRFSAVVMRIREPRTTALIFNSGKMVITGAKSEDDSRLAARKYARIIQKLGFNVRFSEFKIQNLVGSVDVHFAIHLEGLCVSHTQFSSYEPELFPGLIYRMISDEPFDSFLKTEARQLPNGIFSPEKKLYFEPSQVETVFELCVNLRSIVLAVKISGSKTGNGELNPTNACPMFGNLLFSIFCQATSLYARGGFISKFFEYVPNCIYQNLESVCLNVDLSVESFSKLSVPCPTEDLRFALHCLADKHFQTFIQIGFCASEISEEDNETNCMLLAAMHTIAYEMKYYDCSAEVDVGEDEYYCDLTVEKGNMEYSFAFFYYNPHFCEPGTSSVNSSLNNIEILEENVPEMELQYDKVVGEQLEEDFGENSFETSRKINDTDYSSSVSII
ncbi:hypothetical protein FO519_004905 [Halicephalobus sp. NKZ332]|nr:hypothetical protein FO519_004905 [Halicephalobus sp. NKZ332]